MEERGSKRLLSFFFPNDNLPPFSKVGRNITPKMPSGYKEIYQEPILGNILDKNAKLRPILETEDLEKSDL